MNPTAPPLRGLPKVHKPDIPIRPLVNYTTAPSYKLAKKLETILKSQIVLEHNYSVKNSHELVNEIKNMEIKPHQILASFDVVNLYTNVPVTETVALVKDNLEKHSNLLPEAIGVIDFILMPPAKWVYLTTHSG
uniref:Reverse transcriptase domain-containing protein n=1 Tax=Clastoptera arizonana TaxID=38151 RepID=A0A1B6CKL9_9HEMI